MRSGNSLLCIVSNTGYTIDGQIIYDTLTVKFSKFYYASDHQKPLVGTGSAADTKTLVEAIAQSATSFPLMVKGKAWFRIKDPPAGEGQVGLIILIKAVQSMYGNHRWLK